MIDILQILNYLRPKDEISSTVFLEKQIQTLIKNSERGLHLLELTIMKFENVVEISEKLIRE